MDAGERVISGSPATWSPCINSQWDSVEKCSDICRQINCVQRVVESDESPLSGRTQRGLTYYAIKF